LLRAAKAENSEVDKLGMGISDATMLWSLFLVPLPEVGKVRVIGVDDWSWRRGKRFGTLLVNLETHKIVDLLADREAENVKRWLAAHPEVEMVSRDRGGVYIDGATLGAPQATQVADRWHLLSNLGDAVEEFLIRAHIQLPEQGAAVEKEQAKDQPLSSFSATPACQRKSQAHLLRKWKLYQRVQELHAAGMSLRKIGEELGLARNTVRKYFRQAPEPPLPTPRPLRASQLDPYEDYLLERWRKAGAQRRPTVPRNQCTWLSGRCHHCASVCRLPAEHHRRWLCASLTQAACQGHLATRITLAPDT
jgi:hypothetical protein